MKSLRDSLHEQMFNFPIWEPEVSWPNYETENCRGKVTCNLKYDKLIKMYSSLKGVKRDNNREISTITSFDVFSLTPSNPKYRVLLSAGMNGCEIPAIIGLYTFMYELVNSNDQGIKWIRNNCEIKVIPCICPESFNLCRYGNSNNVNINRNFNYNGSWYATPSNKGEWNYSGPYPMSEKETFELHDWLYANSPVTDYTPVIYIDCHTDVTRPLQEPLKKTFDCIASDEKTKNTVLEVQKLIKYYYIEKGYNPTDISCTIAEPISYPKSLITYNKYNIPNIMIEQHAADEGHGGNGKVCSDADIKNYVLMLRAYIIGLLKNYK